MAGRLRNGFRRFLKRTGIRKGLIGGVLVLLVVDLLWVGSAALSRVSGRGLKIIQITCNCHFYFYKSVASEKHTQVLF